MTKQIWMIGHAAKSLHQVLSSLFLATPVLGNRCQDVQQNIGALQEHGIFVVVGSSGNAYYPGICSCSAFAMEQWQHLATLFGISDCEWAARGQPLQRGQALREAEQRNIQWRWVIWLGVSQQVQQLLIIRGCLDGRDQRAGCS